MQSFTTGATATEQPILHMGVTPLALFKPGP